MSLEQVSHIPFSFHWLPDHFGLAKMTLLFPQILAPDFTYSYFSCFGLLVVYCLDITEEQISKIQSIFGCFCSETSNGLKSGFLVVCYCIGNQNSHSPNNPKKNFQYMPRNFLKSLYCGLRLF